MNIKELRNYGLFFLVSEAEDMNKNITIPFCCDLLSIAMGKAPAGAAWVTVMGNINTLAVAALTEVACIILAEGIALDEPAKIKAISEGIAVFRTEQSIFEAAYAIQKLLEEKG